MADISGLNKAKQDIKQLQRVANSLEKNSGSFGLSIELTSEVGDLGKLAALNKNIQKAAAAANVKTLAIVANELKSALNEAMQANVWNWEYGDGDIVDTGALQDSCEVLVEGNSLRVIYNQQYAAIVHYGGYIHPYGNPRVTIYMPGRPWIQSVLAGGGPVPPFDFQDAYNRIFQPIMEQELDRLGAT